MSSAFGCALCGCTNQHPCWDDTANDRCHMVTPKLCSACRDEDHTCPAPTTTNTAPSEPTGPSSSTKDTNPPADAATNQSSPANPSTSATTKTSLSEEISAGAHQNMKLATDPPGKPSAPTPHPAATGNQENPMTDQLPPHIEDFLNEWSIKHGITPKPLHLEDVEHDPCYEPTNWTAVVTAALGWLIIGTVTVVGLYLIGLVLYTITKLAL